MSFKNPAKIAFEQLKKWKRWFLVGLEYPTEEQAQIICEAHYNYNSYDEPRVFFSERRSWNPVPDNYTLRGTLDDRWSFKLEDGNWNGTQFIYFEDNNPPVQQAKDFFKKWLWN